MVSTGPSLSKTVYLIVKGDNGDAKHALDEIEARAEAFKQLHPEMSVTIDKEKALEQAAAVRAAMRLKLGEAIKVPVELDSRGGLGIFLKSMVSQKGWGALAGLLPGLGGIGAAGAAAAPAAAGPAAASGLALLGTPAGAAGAALALWASTPLIVTLLGGLVGAAGAAGAFKIASNANTNLTALLATQTSAQQAFAQAQQQQRFYPSAANAAAVATAGTNLTQANQAVTSFQKANGPALGLYGAVQNVGSAASAAFMSALTGGGNTSFISGLEKIINQIPAFITKVGPQLGAMFRASLPYVQAWVQVLEGFASRVMPAVTSALTRFRPYVIDVVHVFNGLSDVVGGVIRIIGFLAGSFAHAMERIQSNVRRMSGAFEEAADNVRHWFDVALKAVEDVVVGVIRWMEHAGSAIINGLARGIDDATGGLLTKLGGLASKITGYFGHLLGIASPSTVFAGHGRMLVAGLAQGIDQSAGWATAAVGRLAASAAGGISGGGYGGRAGAPQPIILQFQGGGAAEEFLATMLRQYVRSRGGGGKNSVQVAFGQTH